MSYGTLYEMDYYDYFGDYYTIEIQERDYAGAATEIKCGKNPFKISIEDTSNDPFFAVKPQTVVLSVVSETFDYFESVYTNDERKYKVVKKKAGTAIWQGYIRDEEFGSEYVSTPYVVQFEALDALALMKSIDFKQTDGSYYSGKMSEMSIITTCLNKVDLQQDIIDVLDIYEENHNNTLSTDSPLTQTYLDVYIFRDKNCLEVLTEIVSSYGARIIQNEDKIVIERVENSYKTDRTYRRYNYEGTYQDFGTWDKVIAWSNASAAPASLNVPINRSWDLDKVPGLKQLNYNFNLGVTTDLIRDYNEFYIPQGSPIEPYNRDYTLNRDESIEIGILNTYDYLSGLVYTSETMDILAITDLKIKLDLWGNDLYSLVTLCYVSNNVRIFWDDDTQDWQSLAPTYGSWGEEEIDQKHTINSTVRVPNEGERVQYGQNAYGIFQLYFHPKDNVANKVTVNFSEVTYTATYEKTIQSIDKEYELDQNNNESDDIPILIGDAYTIDGTLGRSETVVARTKDGRIFNEKMAEAFCRGILYYLDSGDYKPTRKWFIKGEESNLLTLMELRASQINTLRTRGLYSYSGQMLAHFIPCSVISYDSKYYIIIRNEWNVKYATHNILMIQCTTAAATLLHEDGDIFEYEDGTYAKIE